MGTFREVPQFLKVVDVLRSTGGGNILNCSPYQEERKKKEANESQKQKGKEEELYLREKICRKAKSKNETSGRVKSSYLYLRHNGLLS